MGILLRNFSGFMGILLRKFSGFMGGTFTILNGTTPYLGNSSYPPPREAGKLECSKYMKSSCVFKDVHVLLLKEPIMMLLALWGGTWPSNIWGGAARKSEKAPCRGVKFPKMIPYPGVKFSKTLLCS